VIKMKKQIILTMLMTIMMVTGVVAMSTTTTRSTTGFAISQISSTQFHSGSNSLRLFAADADDPNEARARVTFDQYTTLNNITNISWWQYVTKGYIGHVDIMVSTNGNETVDDAIVFEYDKVTTPSDQALGSMAFTRNAWVNTFDDKGIVDGSSQGWLSSGAPGDINAPGYKNTTLDEWKAGFEGIDGDTRVIALEFEVDGWIAESEAYIDDLSINGEVVQDFETAQDVQVEVDADISVSISPSTLDFGNLRQGTIDNPGPNIKFSAQGSNVNVTVTVTNVTGFPYETGLNFNTMNPIGQIATMNCMPSGNTCTYTDVEWTTSLTVPPGTMAGNYAGTVTYQIAGPTP